MVFVVAVDKWIWLGNACHLAWHRDCEYHLATVVGDVIVSTIGEYCPVKDGKKIWEPEEVGLDRMYETMVFRVNRNTTCKCGCDMPQILYCGDDELDFRGYNNAKEAGDGHMAMCRRYDAIEYPEED